MSTPLRAIAAGPSDDLAYILRDAEARLGAVFERAAVGLCVMSLDGRMAKVNQALAEILGRDLAEVHGVASAEITHPDDRRRTREGLRRLAAGEVPVFRIEQRFVRPDGTEVWVAVSATVIRDGDRPLYFVGQMLDIGERKLVEQALARSERRFRSLVESAPIGIFLVADLGRLVWSNHRFGQILDRPPEELEGLGWLDAVHADDRPGVEHQMREAFATGSGLSMQSRVVTGDGRVRWVQTDIGVVREGENGDGFVGFVRDVTAQVDARRELATREAEFRLLAEHSGDFLSRHAPDGMYRYASPASEALSGFKPAELEGTPVYERVHDDDRDVLRSCFTEAVGRPEQPATAAYRVRCATGELKWCETAVRGVADEEDGAVVELVAVTRDISARKEAELQLTRLAMQDALTGLPNRTLFLDRLGLALRRARRHRKGGSSSVAVLFLDLDRFKVVNDSLGHAYGDRLLVDVALRMQRALRPGDTVARFGGDEFTVLCEDIVGELEAVAIGQRLVDLFIEPFDLGGEEVFVNTSVGIALSTSADDTPDGLVRDADAAMYRAKERGKGRFELFDAAMRASAVERLELENALRRGLDRGELCVHYQPEIGIEHGDVLGFEALVRWEHPERGLLAPADFIPLAEETGLIVAIGDWVLREACAEAVRWLGSGAQRFLMSVNISVRQLAQAGLVESVEQALLVTGLPPSMLCLEITESAVMESGAGMIEILRELKALGVKLAIDDFGTGYSSLSHLRRFPIDLLKIDRTFVDGLGQSPQDASIAAAVISLAHALGLTTVAEGIETPEQLAVLAGLGCDLGQGFLFARPQPAEAARQLVGRRIGERSPDG